MLWPNFEHHGLFYVNYAYPPIHWPHFGIKFDVKDSESLPLLFSIGKNSPKLGSFSQAYFLAFQTKGVHIKNCAFLHLIKLTGPPRSMVICNYVFAKFIGHPVMWKQRLSAPSGPLPKRKFGRHLQTKRDISRRLHNIFFLRINTYLIIISCWLKPLFDNLANSLNAFILKQSI